MWSLMLTRLAVLLALSASTGISELALAQDPRAIDPAVSSVVSGGYWEHGTQHGTYRIVVRAHGARAARWKGPPSTLRVQWLVDDPRTHENRVLVSSPIASIPDGTWSLSEPRRDCRPGDCMLTLYGTDPHTDKMDGESWVIALRGPGEVKLVKNLSPIRADWCVARNERVDNSFAVAQAQRLLEDTLLPLKADSVRSVGMQSLLNGLPVFEGWLVTLSPTRLVLGGGGRVWVDGETGCAIVLRRYE